MTSRARPASKSSLFLIELIITICFFSLSAVVCVRLFLHAHQVSRASREMTEAVRISQNAAECFIAAEGEEAEFLRLFSLTEEASGDAGFPAEAAEHTDTVGAGIRLTPQFEISAEEEMHTLRIRIWNEAGNEVYQLDVLTYAPGP